MIQIRLNYVRPTADGALSGWFPGITPDQAWDAARTEKAFNPGRVLRQRVQIISPDGTIVAVADVRSVTATDSPRLVTLDGPLVDGDPSLGSPTATPHPPRRQFIYVEDSEG